MTSFTIPSILWANYCLLNLLSYFLCFLDKEFPGILIAEEGDWKKCIQGSSAVVNLAGMPISTRWSPEVCYQIKNCLVCYNINRI